MEKKVSESKNNNKKPTNRKPSLITNTGAKGIGKPNKVVDKSKKRKPLDTIPVQKGTGKTYPSVSIEKK